MVFRGCPENAYLRAFLPIFISPLKMLRRCVEFFFNQKPWGIVPLLAKIADENDAYFFGHLEKKESAFLLKILKGLVNHHELRKLPTD